MAIGIDDSCSVEMTFTMFSTKHHLTKVFLLWPVRLLAGWGRMCYNAIFAKAAVKQDYNEQYTSGNHRIVPNL